MKKLPLLLLFVNVAFGQIGEITSNIGEIKIRSKVDLTYNSRDQKHDTIYIAIKRWNYDQNFYIAEVIDYRRLEAFKYEVIASKFKSFPKATVDYLFGQLKPMVNPELNYSEFLNSLLTYGLLLDTQTNLIGDKTVYGGLPQDWEIAPDDVPIVVEPTPEPTPTPIEGE